MRSTNENIEIVKENKRDNNVTIVVLIILAGISINSIIGENGLIKKGQKLKQECVNWWLEQ